MGSTWAKRRSKWEAHGQREDEISIGDGNMLTNTGYVIFSSVDSANDSSKIKPERLPQAGMAHERNQREGHWFVEESKRGLLERLILRNHLK
jgi:3-methyladenine DNA glycosylase AlkC